MWAADALAASARASSAPRPTTTSRMISFVASHPRHPSSASHLRYPTEPPMGQRRLCRAGASGWNIAGREGEFTFVGRERRRCRHGRGSLQSVGHAGEGEGTWVASESGSSGSESDATSSAGSVTKENDGPAPAPADDPLARRVAVMVSASSGMQLRRATQCLRDNPEVVDALRSEAGQGHENVEDVERRIAGVLSFLGKDMKLDRDQQAFSSLLMEHPEVLALDAEENLRPVLEFLVSSLAQGGAGLTHPVATKTLCAYPGLLALDVSKTLRPRTEYLVNEAGLRPSNVAQMLHLELHRDIKPRVEFLAHECHLGDSEAAALIRRNPRVFFQGLEDALRPVLRCLKEDTVLTNKDVAHVVKKFPQVLFQNSESVRERIAFFTEALDAETAAKLMVRYPPVLTMSVELVRPRVGFFCNDLELGKEGTGKVLAKAPTLLCLTEENLLPKLNFFVQDVGLSREELTTMVIRFPSVLTTDLENNLMPTTAFLRSVCEEMRKSGVDADGMGIETVLTRHPSLLAMSVDRKLRPTLTFLRHNYPNCSLSVAMRMCTFSLSGNIMPRVRLVEMNEDKSLKHRWSLATFMSWSVAEFCAEAGVSSDDYAAMVASCEAEFRKLVPLENNGKKLDLGSGADKASPRVAIRSAIRGGTSVANGEAMEARRAARRKKREDEMNMRKRSGSFEDGGDMR